MTPAIVRWPLRSFLELGALPGAVPCARLHTRQVLWEWGLSEAADTGELIVSELVTNAVKASVAASGRAAIPVVRLALASDRREVLVEVWDGNPAPPAAADPGPDGESGRGLLLVDAVSSSWGYYYPAAAPGPHRPAGKVVWALADAAAGLRHQARS